MTTDSLKSYEFRREREATWLELEELVQKVERHGLKSLQDIELNRLPVLYRATMSSLSVARSISLDRALLAYLEALAGRAYFCVYGTRRSALETVGEFLWVGFPGAVRRFRRQIALAATVMALGAVVGLLQTQRDENRFYSFVDAEYAQGRDPASSTADLRGSLYDHGAGAVDGLSEFASFLFSHNAKIGMLCFALGFAAGVPVVVLLFTNGLLLGAFAALYQSRGLGVDFWGWVLPHGVTELSALVLCGGAGLVLGQALIQPGRYGRLQNLARHGRAAGRVVLGAVLMFFVAAGIEGFFRQLVHDIATRYAVAIGTSLFWLAYFGLAGRRRTGAPTLPERRRERLEVQ